MTQPRHWIPRGEKASGAADVPTALSRLLTDLGAGYATAGQLRERLHGNHPIRTAAVAEAVSRGLIVEEDEGPGWPKWYSLPGVRP